MMKTVSCKGNRIAVFTYLGVVAVVTHQLKWNYKIRNETPTRLQFTIVEAFAAKRGGGFGGGGGFGVSKTRNNKKVNKKIKKRGNLAGMEKTTTKKQQEQFHSPSKTKGPELDKWGLPIATLEDIFPPLAESTEVHPIESSKDRYSLSEIQECIKSHVDLGDLNSVFDDRGVAVSPNQDGSTMRIRLLHRSPPVLALENFLTTEECRDIQKVAERERSTHRVGSATFQGALSTRTSTSWFCHYTDLPVLIAKAHHILGVPLETMEEPQIVRYKGGEEFSWHYDEVPQPQLSNGGQRLATLLVYLTDVPSWKGGGTTFRDLKESSSSSSSLVMQPRRGSALLFFPSFADGTPDDRTLHKSEVLKEDSNEDNHKWIVQMWTHQQDYQASLPFGNSNEAARDKMKETAAKLGYN